MNATDLTFIFQRTKTGWESPPNISVWILPPRKDWGRFANLLDVVAVGWRAGLNEVTGIKPGRRYPDSKDVILIDQRVDILDKLTWRTTVVEVVRQHDLASVDSALGIDGFEIGDHAW